jgi:hypothetical protein
MRCTKHLIKSSTYVANFFRIEPTLFKPMSGSDQSGSEKLKKLNTIQYEKISQHKSMRILYASINKIGIIVLCAVKLHL